MISPEALTILSKPNVQAFIQERMGHLRYGDWCLMNIGYGIGVEQVIWQAGMDETDDVIRIPLPINPFNPERGVEGMIHGAVSIYRTFGVRDWVVNVTAESDISQHKADTPLLALIRALEAQLEGGKG